MEMSAEQLILIIIASPLFYIILLFLADHLPNKLIDGIFGSFLPWIAMFAAIFIAIGIYSIFR